MGEKQKQNKEKRLVTSLQAFCVCLLPLSVSICTCHVTSLFSHSHSHFSLLTPHGRAVSVSGMGVPGVSVGGRLICLASRSESESESESEPARPSHPWRASI
ncbi:hypothetical protein FVEG_15595 [Fusarium verticillioides 7600]|uniref:Uncharacterized protein n=1 Tax=Gibberella moniliformis (strain M3125 / FGSC 7600) TaxID=334819 RepID=W7LYP3_GIBM7|nr:hypothetical protein FVEG_15595 [Fusarium verticillioides 7600]EWG43786.1 hypothetical protein FVEG_15595 [Fusarium verticillioides 7600]